MVKLPLDVFLLDFFEFPWPKGDSRIWDNDYLCVNAHIESKCAPGKPKRKWTMENYRIPKSCLADHATLDACVSKPGKQEKQ